MGAATARHLPAWVPARPPRPHGGRIGTALVQAELQRLRWHWQHVGADARTVGTVRLDALIGEEAFEAMDLFDRLQLEAVVRVCRESKTLSDAGRKLFHRSRKQRSVVNDADRLRKYLQKHGLSWAEVCTN